MQTQNEEDVQMLQSMMGDLDAEVARRVLAKHNNDIQAAASAILEGDRGDDLPTVSTAWGAEAFETSAGGSGALNVSRRPNTPVMAAVKVQPADDKDVIDLTADNDPDLSRALQMSLEHSQSQTPDENVFRRSDRAPDPNWAMVPSNVASNTVQEQEDQSLSRAIEASLSTSFVEDKYEDLPDVEKARKPGHPVALRTSSTELYFATLVLQALFHVPQVRERLALWRWNGNEIGYPSAGSPDLVPYLMCGLFTFMDYAVVSYLSIDNLGITNDYRGKLATSATDLPGELSNELYCYIARDIENALRSDSSALWDRLFLLRYAFIEPSHSADSTGESNALDIENCQPAYSKGGSDTPSVRVDLRGTDGPNDLISCLSSQLGLEPRPTSDEKAAIPSAFSQQAQALVAPSDVIAFELVRPSHAPGPLHGPAQQNSNLSSPVATPFRYPMQVYLDQFLLENASLACEKRVQKNEMAMKLKELIEKKESLTHFEGKATLKSLTSTLYYFENIASKDNSEPRSQEIKSAATSLQMILNKINAEVQALDTQISKLRVDIEKVFDDTALQKHRYDLRAVLVHDGLFGRCHIHSFVQYGGRWWKCQDANVVEVSEEVVLTDTTGLHLGSGPYMLIYSRETDEEVDLKSCWPTFFRNNAKVDSEEYLQGLDEIAPEVAVNLRAAFPINIPVAVPDEMGEKAPRRSMSAMSIVDDGGAEDETEMERMDLV